MNRRRFLSHAGTVAGAIALNRLHYPLFATTKKYANDRVQLGPARLVVSRLALGTGTHGSGGSSNQTRKLGLKGMADLFKAAYDQGVNFWDSADQYGSHPHLKDALKSIPREKVVILTKTHASTEQQMRVDLDRFRRELGTDYIDILLLHCMISPRWPEEKQGAMNVILEAQQKNIVKTRGVSCHTLGALKTAASSPWVQVNLARINPAGVIMDADPETVLAILRQMKANGKGIIGMKILGEGRLRDRVDECLRYTLALDCVDCFTIGVENRAEFDDLISRIPRASVHA